MLCPETESNRLCKIKKRGFFKATPGILSVSLKGGLPIKFWTAPRAATGRTRAGQADRCHPGSGTSPGLSAALQPRHFLLASAPSIPVSIRAIDTLSRRVSLALPCQLLQNLGALGQDFRGYSQTGKCPGHLHIQIPHQLSLFA